MAVVPAGAAEDPGDCATCHENLARSFRATTHGRIAAFEAHDGRTGCVTCHGDGAEHMDAGGDPTLIRSLDETTALQTTTEVCMNCHRAASLHDWAGSEHPLNQVGCTDCHEVHPTGDAVRTASEICMDCHTDVRAQFSYPSHHPLREGHMTCASCHDPHGSSIGLVRSDERPEEVCLSCHTQYSGPFLYEHEAVYEGCDSCHAPHGAVANNLLVQNEPFLCLQCHEMHFHAGLEAEEDDEVYVPRYDPDREASDGESYPGGLVPNPWGESGYKRAFATRCTQCHTHVHGSDLPSQAVGGLGEGLMR
jgi:DmsE family decaheme c-type cytochrome